MSVEQDTPPVVAGYTIRRLLAQGGMGSVYEAVHDTLDRRVAIKVLQRRWAEDAAFADRFLREARIAARIDHPGVITVHDAGRDTDGRLYLAMGFVEGGDLAAWLREPSPLIEADVLRLGIRCAEALGKLHAEGLIHRDIKPDNILMTPAGDPVITDLGLARSETGDDRMTRTGQVVGTPAYMSPEQATAAADIDHRSDLYSLGATLYALLAGRPPFRGDTPWATVAAIIKDPAPDLRDIRPTIQPATAELIARCLAKDPARRPASATELAAGLAACADAIAAGRSSTAATMIAADPSPAATPRPMAATASGRSPMLPVVLGALGLVVVAGLIAGLAASLGEGEAAPAEPPAESPPAPAVTTAPASTAPFAPRQDGGRLARATTERQTRAASPAADATDAADPAPDRGDAIQTSIKSGFFAGWSDATGALSEEVAGDVATLEPRIRARLGRQGLTIETHEIDDGIAEIEGEIDGNAYRVSIHPIDAERSKLVIESGFPRNAERQQRIRDLLGDVVRAP